MHIRAAADEASPKGIPAFLDSLLRIPGPSGQEAAAAAAWRDGCRGFTSEVDVDVNGSSWARVPGTREGRSLALVGHIDEIGVHVTHIDDDGFLRFGQVGGWDPVNLASQRVVLATRTGPIRGVIGRKAIHLMDEEDRKRVPQLTDFHIDIGAVDGADAHEMVRIGDTGVLDVEPLLLPHGRIVSRSLDNRVGCYVAARAAQLIAGDGGAAGDVLAMAVVQEELGSYGSRMAAHRHRPHVAIAIDVTHASDIPGIKLGPDTHHRIGSGPSIQRASLLHPGVFEALCEAAESENIPYTITSGSRNTATDADALSLSREGIPTGLVEVPLRYMHSSVEMVSLDDVEVTARLLAAFARRLEPETTFAR